MKVRQTLQAANKINNKTLNTIEQASQVIEKHDSEQRNFVESINKHMELTCNKQAEKYQGKPQRVIEPNLSKRMQARKERAALLAQRNESQHFMD